MAARRNAVQRESLIIRRQAMKSKVLFASFTALYAAFAAAPVFADNEIPLPKLINLGAEYVFAPPGFDNNDNVQIVLHGELPSTCFKAAKPAVKVDRASRKIYVAAMAYSYTGCFCLDVLTPFTQTADLGLLATGQYQVIEVDGQGKQMMRAILPVGTAKGAQPDDFLYAPVTSASIDRSGTQPVLHLGGILQSDCLELAGVKTLHRVPRIIEVLPIVAQKPGVACMPHNRSFETRVALPASESGDNLIHIRSMNGNSINLVEEL
jgi:hypothetical protein